MERLDWDGMVLVGRVARVHGLRGEVIVNPETDFPEERFRPGGTIYRRRAGTTEALQVATCRMHRGRPIVGFEGLNAVEDAEPLAGDELRVPADWLAPLPPGTYYLHELVGCRVQLASGEAVGIVDRVDGDGGAARLVVASASGEVLVPLASDICRQIDAGAKLIVIEPPEGLLVLNLTRPREHARRPPRGRRLADGRL